MNTLLKKAMCFSLLLSLTPLQAAGFWETIKNNIPAPTAKNAFLGTCVLYTCYRISRKCFSLLRSLGYRQETQTHTPEHPVQLSAIGPKLISITLRGAQDRITIDTSDLDIYHPKSASIDCKYSVTRNSKTLKVIRLQTKDKKYPYTITQQKISRDKNLVYISDGKENGSNFACLQESHPLRQWATAVLQPIAEANENG